MSPGSRHRTRARSVTKVEIETTLRRIGSLIRRERMRDGLSLADLADRCIVSIPTLRKAERGDPTVGLGVVAAALWHLGVVDRFMECLVSGEDAAEPARREH
jgi:transcriptional regulator with XRE-family HTH domain